MIEKIKRISGVEWALMAGLVILLDALPMILSNWLGYQGRDFSLFSPWQSAASVSSLVSIDLFKEGMVGDNAYIGWRMLTLASVWLCYIIGPGLLILFGIGSSSGDTEESTSRSLLFKAGIVLTIIALLNVGKKAITNPIKNSRTQIMAQYSAHTDQMRSEMIQLGHAGYEYFVLPDSLNGGDGSFEGIDLEEVANRNDLNLSAGTYRFKIVSDTLLRITGKGAPSTLPAEKDSIRLALEVHPKVMLDWQDKGL